MARRYDDDPRNLDKGFRERRFDDQPDPEEREKKSWREKDRQKDRSAHRREEPPDRAGRGGARRESQAYQSYKSQLNKLFDGGGASGALKEKMDAAGIGKEKKARKAASKAIVDAAKPAERVKALQAYRDEHGFPRQEDVLATLLDLDDEAEIVLEALETIETLLEEGGLKRAGSFKARVKTVKMTVDDDDVVDAADRLLKKL
ncbi:MAG: hypothetical protein V3T05_03910 [Myxococcota bacterium]